MPAEAVSTREFIRSFVESTKQDSRRQWQLKWLEWIQENGEAVLIWIPLLPWTKVLHREFTEQTNCVLCKCPTMAVAVHSHPPYRPLHLLRSSYSVSLAFVHHFSVEASCVAMLIPNNVFDCKTRGESSVDFAANCTFAGALVEKMEFCQYCPSFLCLLPIFNSPVIAFHFVKGTVLLFYFF